MLPGRVNDPNDLRAIDKVLLAPTGAKDIVAACIGFISPEKVKRSPSDDFTVDDHIKDIFSEVVFSAEKQGKPVKLLALPGESRVRALLEAATSPAASELWLGFSHSKDLEQQWSKISFDWRATDTPRQDLRVMLVKDTQDETECRLLHR